MIPGAQLLTAPTSLANYKPEDISTTAKSLISSSFVFLHVTPDTPKTEERMAHSRPHTPSRQRSRTNDDTELWFSMPSSARREQHDSRVQNQPDYQATSGRHGATRSASPSAFPAIPLISTSPEVNKPLPPSPESEKKKRKPASLRNLIRRRPSGGLDPTHLQPEPYQHHQRSASANGKLSPEPYQYYPQQLSRSMPSSPLQFSHTAPNPVNLQRAHSASAHYADSNQYQAYSLQPQPQPPQRSSSMETYFEPQVPRARRTFPETNTPSSATPRDSFSERPRPHTWLSPTEPFEDASEFHLFVEATSGLPDGFDPLSPSGAPHLQGSLFSRGRQNDRIPLPFQHSTATQSSQTHFTGGWQNMGYDYLPQQSTGEVTVSSSALPRRDSYEPSLSPAPSPRGPNLNAINLELERLGLTDEEQPDDELPNYAQSQAEMSEKKRKEAAARARELEARWNNSRGWRSR